VEAKIEFITEGSVTSPHGFTASAVSAGIKYPVGSRLDVGVLYSDTPCNAAALFTKNRVKAAPLILSQMRVKTGKISALVVNSGNANACTGEQGMADAVEMASAAAKHVGVTPDSVLVASTGVIGVMMPMQNLKTGLGKLALSSDGGHDLARAIMTTDTVPKEVAVSVKYGNGMFTIGGIAKGSGMLHPDMATMLCFLTTDAAVERVFLQKALKDAVDSSINMVSVDGDTSTNDCVFLLANGRAGNPEIKAGGRLAGAFTAALKEVCVYLAKRLAADGEGATKMIEVMVKGAANTRQARLVARTVTSSNLLKAAVYGNDPNWGRVLAAAGRSGVPIGPDRVDLYFGDICVMRAGTPLPFNAPAVVAILKQKEVPISLDLHMGKAGATAWGCDLTEQYVKINAEYTT
jgi:glutamate N-acetyltransferase/amino-acid N-acetyltransferase